VSDTDRYLVRYADGYEETVNGPAGWAPSVVHPAHRAMTYPHGDQVLIQRIGPHVARRVVDPKVVAGQLRQLVRDHPRNADQPIDLDALTDAADLLDLCAAPLHALARAADERAVAEWMEGMDLRAVIRELRTRVAQEPWVADLLRRHGFEVEAG
jgi:hypothetical protein